LASYLYETVLVVFGLFQVVVTYRTEPVRHNSLPKILFCGAVPTILVQKAQFPENKMTFLIHYLIEEKLNSTVTTESPLSVCFTSEVPHHDANYPLIGPQNYPCTVTQGLVRRGTPNGYYDKQLLALSIAVRL